MSMDDIKYMRPEDLINLVPPEQFRHKLLMTILVRRYIFNDLDNQSDNDSRISNVSKHTNDSSSTCYCSCSGSCICDCSIPNQKRGL